jgi:hypothetical protein
MSLRARRGNWRTLICSSIPACSVSSPGLTGRPSTPQLIGSIAAASGILDHPPSRVMTTECVTTISRHEVSEFCNALRPNKSEGAGNAGCTLHPRSRVQKMHKEAHTSIQVQRRQSDIPCAMVLTVSFVLSPATGLSCHRRSREALASQELDASVGASGPHDFAVRIGTLVSRTAASTASHPNVRDDGQRPSCGTGWRELVALICPTAKVEYFSDEGWTGFR